MIVVRAPLRITLGGGGSDLERGAGFCIAAAIDKYVTVAVNNPFTDDYVLKYSAVERVQNADEIQHPIIRAAVELTHTPPGVEISSMADVPAGTGLGSSGAFTVAMLHALTPDASKPWLATHACDIDTGQQDQWSAAYGGINWFDFEAGSLTPINTTLGPKLALYFTGITRMGKSTPLSLDVLHEQAIRAWDALRLNNPKALGDALTEQWGCKLAKQYTATHREVNNTIDIARASGAYGGKLVGAGGGGFILFVVRDLPMLHNRMVQRGLRRVPFAIDYAGSTRLL